MSLKFQVLSLNVVKVVNNFVLYEENILKKDLYIFIYIHKRLYIYVYVWLKEKLDMLYFVS